MPNPEKRALVTGGMGFIGSNLALELEHLGYDVVIADHGVRPQNVRGFRGELVEADVTRRFDLPGKFDAVFHQAAITDPRHADDKETYERNLEGFRQMIDFARRKSARLVYASTAGLYGNGRIPMHEDQPKDVLTAYGRSKLDMDELTFRIAGELGGIVGLRYFNVFGPREAAKGRPASMIFHLAGQMKAGKRPRLFKHGEQCRDHIYVKDIVSANLCALTAPSGVYNVGTGIGTSFNELVETLNAVLGTRLEPEYFDMPYDAATYQHNTVADTKLAEKNLGFKAKWTLRDGVADYMKWLDANPEG